VTRLDDFLPFRRLFTCATFLKIKADFRVKFFVVKDLNVLTLTKPGWHFGRFFLQTHPVTLAEKQIFPQHRLSQ
jgi:Na+/H+ antiporter NhaB